MLIIFLNPFSLALCKDRTSQRKPLTIHVAKTPAFQPEDQKKGLLSVRGNQGVKRSRQGRDLT